MIKGKDLSKLIVPFVYRWRENKPGEWTSVLADRVWTFTQTDDKLLYKVYHKTKNKPNFNSATQSKKYKSPKLASLGGESLNVSEPLGQGHTCDNDEAILRDYFQTDVSIVDLYKKWSKADAHFEKVANSFQGVRMLRQHPVENLFAFICSSNNNISRISAMVEKMCTHYGEKILELDGHEYYSFPTVDALAAEGVETKLRELGFGYRAKYISLTARIIAEHHSEEWLFSLRHRPYHEVKAELMKLCGVGAKVGGLFSL